jgi:predicted AAA+ superfamily ATPase
MTLELKKFNMREITFKPNENKGPVIVLIGRRDTGKSFLVRDLLFYHQDIPDRNRDIRNRSRKRFLFSTRSEIVHPRRV